MRTKEDWAKEILAGCYCDTSNCPDSHHLEFIERIQADAIRQFKNICSWQGCIDDAASEVIIVLRPHPSVKAPPEAGIRMVTGLLICQSHRAVAKVDDYVTDDMWEQFKQMVARVGKMRPSRSQTWLDFIDFASCVCAMAHAGKCKSNKVDQLADLAEKIEDMPDKGRLV